VRLNSTFPQDDADLPAQPGRIGECQVDAVDQHAAVLRRWISRTYCSCPPSRGADDADELPSRDMQ